METRCAPAKLICIVLDSNVWKQEPLLRTAASETLLKTVRYCQGVIALPEVVEREVITHAGQDAVRYATFAHQLKPFITSESFLIPQGRDPKPYEELAKERLDELVREEYLLRCPTTDPQLRRAYERVMIGKAPKPPQGSTVEGFSDLGIHP